MPHKDFLDIPKSFKINKMRAFALFRGFVDSFSFKGRDHESA